MASILITPRALTCEPGHPALELLRQAGHEMVFCSPGRQPDAEELRRLLPGCLGWLAGVERIDEGVLAAATDLRVISRNGVGVDNIDLAAAARRRIAVCKADGANAQGVAELAIGLLLALLRSIPCGDTALKVGRWERRKGLEVQERTLGVVGYGQIGRRTARLAVGLGMRILACDIHPDPTFPHSERFRFCCLEELLAGAQIVSLHCPALPGGAALIGRDALGKMKPGSYLINTARASLVDEEAILEALQSGRLAGYATDAYTQEPPPVTPLLLHERVIATPHAGGFTEESVSRAAVAAAENILRALKDR